jgi:2-methylisocitrate lyase-like PEP mutase family enzyme
MSAASQFRSALTTATQEPLIVPSVFDALSAKLVARAGFAAAWMGGSGISITHLGEPDAGYINLSDMELVLRRAIRAAEIPLLADIDNGYGSYAAVVRSISIVEAAGAAGAQIDDQIGHQTPGSHVIPVVSENEIVGKIKAAVDARRDSDFFIMARTDALSAHGISAVIDRVNRFAEVGADGAYISGLVTPEGMSRVKRETAISHRMLTRIPDDMPLTQMRELGFDIVALGQADMLRSAALSMWQYVSQLHSRKLEAHTAFRQKIAGTVVADWPAFTGLHEALTLEQRYATLREE